MDTNYSFDIKFSEEDQCYITRCPEFPGLSAHGDTAEKALHEATVALEAMIESYQDHGKKLPEPKKEQAYSGQFRVRLPKSLHRQLADQAYREGVSLNSFVQTLLALGLGKKQNKKTSESIS